jgi:hypothetical protein
MEIRNIPRARTSQKQLNTSDPSKFVIESLELFVPLRKVLAGSRPQNIERQAIQPTILDLSAPE